MMVRSRPLETDLHGITARCKRFEMERTVQPNTNSTKHIYIRARIRIYARDI